MRKWQFPLRFLFAQLTLIAATGGAIRIALFTRSRPDTHLMVLVSLFAAFAVPILCGAIVAAGAIFK